jgi:hypothetical protein
MRQRLIGGHNCVFYQAVVSCKEKQTPARAAKRVCSIVSYLLHLEISGLWTLSVTRSGKKFSHDLAHPFDLYRRCFIFLRSKLRYVFR